MILVPRNVKSFWGGCGLGGGGGSGGLGGGGGVNGLAGGVFGAEAGGGAGGLPRSGLKRSKSSWP